jgi:hypothetical protein
MRTLHITPGVSAGGSLIRAVRDAGRDDEVLPFCDDLSCGPIDSDAPSARANWWGQFYAASEMEGELRQFWDRVTSTRDHLVVWFGRRSALELAFFLAWADRLQEQTYHVVDVTGRQLPFKRRDGSVVLSEAVRSVSIVQPDALRSLFGEEQPITAQERDKSRRQWQQLRRENAPFRIVTETGLASTSIDHFDPMLLTRATSEWQTIRRLIGYTMAENSEPYFQVGDWMLQARLVALVDQGRLLADGDPWDMSSRVRLQT